MDKPKVYGYLTQAMISCAKCRKKIVHPDAYSFLIRKFGKAICMHCQVENGEKKGLEKIEVDSLGDTLTLGKIKRYHWRRTLPRRRG